MLESEENKEYLPIQGLEAFNKATAELLLGKDHAAIKVRVNLAQSHGRFETHGAATVALCA